MARIAAGMLAALIVSLVACAPTTVDTPTAVPTQPLIPVVPTDTPIPPTVTPTQSARLRPADLLTPTAVDSAQIVRQLLINDASSRLGVLPTGIQVTDFQEARWFDGDTLDCGTEPGEILRTPTIEGYEAILAASDTVFVYHTDDEDQIVLCYSAPISEVPGDILIRVDPIAYELFFLAQRQIAGELDLSTRRVELVEMQIITWPDTSLGCPDPNLDYVQMLVPGYRMVLEARDEQYVYHADNDRVTACDPGDVVLPDSTP